MNIAGILMTVISAMIFGFTPVLTKYIYGLGGNAMTVIFYRNLIIMPVLYLLAKRQHASFQMRGEMRLNMLITGVIGSTGTTLLLSYSYNWISVGTATTLHFLYPIFVALLCRFCYGEKLGGGKTLALILALLGTCCFMDLHDMEKMGGLLMAVGSGCTYAFYMVLTEKKNLKEINPFVYSFNISLIICVCMLLLNLFTHEIIWRLDLVCLGLIVLLAILNSVFAITLLQVGIKKLGATTASIFCLFEPINSVVCEWLFLNESLSFSKLLGCTIIIAAIVLLVVFENRKVKQRRKAA
ncbi:DMT family transporter [Dielma fastidiosa]|uniref:DMT family transporter n=1 Tax=Dielma fastidiosa TaxID=1034346 RepID=UPI000EC29238|nr:DMT family transporter [Dielma fastidiosa]HAH94488.1 EamA family transporter [Dielma fastidiosa]